MQYKKSSEVEINMIKVVKRGMFEKRSISSGTLILKRLTPNEYLVQRARKSQSAMSSWKKERVESQRDDEGGRISYSL